MENDRRPYAAKANVLSVLERARSRNLPETIDNDFLRLTGMPEVVFGRVMQVLAHLDLIHEDGRPTDKLHALAGAPEGQYTELLAECIRAAYHEDFERIDPEKDNQATIIDAFRRYEPRSQTSRMVMLFLGLCRAAAIPVQDAPRERRLQARTGNGEQPNGKKKKPDVQQRQRAGDPFAAFNPRPAAMFSVTEDDIAALDDNEFQIVWDALGKVARARARKRREREKAGAVSDSGDGEPDDHA